MLPAKTKPPLRLGFQELEVERARAFMEASTAPATLRAYKSDWSRFCGWCAERDLPALPAHPGAVGLFLSGEADAGVKASTINRRAAAIRHFHVAGRLPSPTADPEVRRVMIGVRRQLGVRPAQKAPATAARLVEMLKHCPDSLRGKRDRAILALGFSGAFRRSELVALKVADLDEVPDGLRITIRRSKTDQEGTGHEIAVLRGSQLRAVEAVRDWLSAAGITAGPIFRRIWKNDRVADRALTAEVVADLVKQYASLAGFNAALFAGHSLRAGFLTSAAEAGADVFRMMDVSRHKKVETIRTYVRRADAFKDHAGRGFL